MVIGQSDLMAAFHDRVHRHVADAGRQYRDELRALSNEMAARGLGRSGPHLKRRVEVLRKWSQLLTDQCFEDVTRLPGNRELHRVYHASFLADQLRTFISQAAVEILCFEPGPAASTAIKAELQTIEDALQSDLQDFQSGLWRTRSDASARMAEMGRLAGRSTINNVTIQGSHSGPIQLAGDAAIQTISTPISVGTIQVALDDFLSTLKTSAIPEDLKQAALIEVETISPQLKKPNPNSSIIREGLHSLRTILEGAAAGLLTNKLTALLVAAGIAMS